MDTGYILELEGITKRFLSLIANNNISLKVKENEVLAILGENGAGKSTLMNILTGLYQPDSGVIKINDKPVRITSPKEAIKNGIGMVHQHFRLVDKMTVVENIALGLETQGFVIDWNKVKKEIANFSERLNFPINPDKLVADLSVGEKQRVEIIKVLYRGCKILILDEPTSVLTPSECTTLFEVLENIRKQGITILFISHKLNEIMQFADRIAVMRKGKLIKTVAKQETNPQQLVNLMVGSELILQDQNVSHTVKKNEVRLEVKGLCAKGDLGEITLDNVNMEIRSGEILGIAAVSGNGQSQLAEVLSGMSPASSGSICFMGEELINKKTLDYINKGISHIPEDRMGIGTIPAFSCVENAILKNYRVLKTKFGNEDYKAAEEQCSRYVKEYNIMMTQPKAEIRLLSGGNIQKLILAREIGMNPKLLIAVHPTYGLDASAVNMIRNILVEQSRKGVAILLISEDLDELMQISSSISVMFKGYLTPKIPIEKCTIEEIGNKMMGIGVDKIRSDALHD